MTRLFRLLPVAALALLAACGVPPTPEKGSWPPLVDVVGDSTLFGAHIARPIVGARGIPASSPPSHVVSIEYLDAPRILWVFVGTNGTPGFDDDVAAVTSACQRRRCMVAVQGVVPAYDAAMVAIAGVMVCDLRPLQLYRPDGVHPDYVGSGYMSAELSACRNRLADGPDR